MSEAEAPEPTPAPAPAPAAGDPVVVEDAQGQQWHVDASELSEYVRSGQYQIAPDQYQVNPGQGIPVYQNGKLGYLPSTQADAAIRAFDADAAPSGVVAADEDKRFYSTPLQTARAASAGFLRGATLGLSDQALTRIDPTLAPELQGLQRANPNLTTATELGGAVAPFLLGGGALGGAARAIGAPVRAVGAVGEAAGALGSRLGGVAFNAGGSALGAAGARAVGAAARGAAEFGLFEGGREISQAALEQRDIDGDKLLAAMGHGALMGAALGGAGSVAMSGGRAVAGAAADAAAGAGRALVEKGRDLGAQALEAASPLVERGKAAVEGGVQKLERSGALDSLGRERVIKSTGANLKQIEELRAMGADAEDRFVRKGLEAGMDQTTGKLRTRTEMAEHAKMQIEKDGAEVGKLVDQMHAAGVRTDMRAFIREQRAGVVQKLEGKIDPDLERAVKEVDGWYDKLHSASGDPRMVWETKHTLGNRIDWRAGTENVANELKKDLYFGLDRKLVTMGTESAERMGPGFEKVWRAANDEYRVARLFRDATEKGASSELRNNAFGMGEYAAGVGMATIAGGPLGIPMALAGMAAKNLSRRYGSQALGQALLQPGAIDRMIAGVDAQIGGRARALLTQGKEVGGKVLGAAKEAAAQGKEGATKAGADLVEAASKAADKSAAAARGGVREAATRSAEFTERRDQLQSYQAARAAAPQASPLPPGVTAAVDRGAAFLAGKMPVRAQVKTVDPRDPARMPSDADQARWLRYARAVDKPLEVMEQIRQGVASREAIEALKAVYPRLFAQIQGEVQTAIAGREQPLTTDERRKLSYLLDLPATAAHNPATGAAVQAALSGAAGGPQPGAVAPPQPPARPMKTAALAGKSEQMEGALSP